MKTHLSISLAIVGVVVGGQALGQIYRCGNEYTNTVPEAQKGQCKLIEGGNVTVIQGFKPPVTKAAAPTVRLASANPPAARADNAEQKARDSDARQILESELKRAEDRQAELMREYNNGEPEKRGDEARNYQKYLDRVADLKANLARNDSDIAGIRREIGRVSASK